MFSFVLHNLCIIIIIESLEETEYVFFHGTFVVIPTRIASNLFSDHGKILLSEWLRPDSQSLEKSSDLALVLLHWSGPELNPMTMRSSARRTAIRSIRSWSRSSRCIARRPRSIAKSLRVRPILLRVSENVPVASLPLMFEECPISIGRSHIIVERL